MLVRATVAVYDMNKMEGGTLGTVGLTWATDYALGAAFTFLALCLTTLKLVDGSFSCTCI